MKNINNVRIVVNLALALLSCYNFSRQNTSGMALLCGFLVVINLFIAYYWYRTGRQLSKG